MGSEHWHVLGAGAMGCLYAEALQRSGCQATLVMRQGTMQRSLPVTVESEGESGIVRREQHLRVITPDDREAISHLLITTKAYDVRDAVASIVHLLQPDSVIVLLVNGMGLAEELLSNWPQLDVYCGTSTEGAYRIAAQHIRHAGRGETRVGRQGLHAPPPWFGQWTNAIERCIWDADITTALWSKLAVNCIINPLTAVHNCLNGELGKRSDLAEQVALLCDEVAQVSRASGFNVMAATLDQTVASVITGTAANRSSMLQDVQHGRRTEIDYITGYLLQVADRHGIAAPHNRALLARLLERTEAHAR